MRRREFITVLGSAFTSWPLAAVAQQQSRMRRIGLLMNGLKEDDPKIKSHLAAIQEALSSLGWVRGQTIQIEFRAASDLEGLQSEAAELLNYEPNLMVTYSTPATNVVRQASAHMRIVFITVSDPIGPGFVNKL